MASKRKDKTQEACDLVRIQKKDKHVHGTRTITYSRGSFLKDSNQLNVYVHIVYM